MRYHRLGRRIQLAMCAGLASVCYVYAQKVRDSPHMPPSALSYLDSASKIEPAEWTHVGGSDSMPIASEIATAAKREWIANGLDEAKATQLSDDVGIILTALFTPDFQKYHHLMTSRGLALDAMATSLADQLIAWEFYPANTPELASDRPIEQRIAYVWNHPNERRVEWSSVRIPSLAVGFGLVIDGREHAWPYPGNYAQMSVYIPPHGRLTVTDGEAVNASKDSAWISIEGRFKSGMQTRTRINFYYDKSMANWVPLNIVFGTDGDHRPFPLL